MDTPEKELKQIKNRYSFMIFFLIIIVMNFLWIIHGKLFIKDEYLLSKTRIIADVIIFILAIINATIHWIALRKMKIKMKESGK